MSDYRKPADPEAKPEMPVVSGAALALSYASRRRSLWQMWREFWCIHNSAESWLEWSGEAREFVYVLREDLGYYRIVFVGTRDLRMDRINMVVQDDKVLSAWFG